MAAYSLLQIDPQIKPFQADQALSNCDSRGASHPLLVWAYVLAKNQIQFSSALDTMSGNLDCFKVNPTQSGVYLSTHYAFLVKTKNTT